MLSFVSNRLRRKKLNCLTKTLAALFPAIALLPLSGCASRLDYTLNPPVSNDWVTVTVKLPQETEALPLDVLYRSETCRKEVYDNTSESHMATVRGVNPQLVSLSQTDSSGYREAKIALNGGGKCGWKLSGIRLGIQLSKTSALANGKNIISTSYVFDFDDEGYRNAFGYGNPKNVVGNLRFETDFFPLIQSHRDGEMVITLFGGDIRDEKWKRYYRVSSISKIVIEPSIHMSKVVRVVPPNSLPGDLIATYPDGSTGILPYIYPDYEKLLSMK